MSSDGGLSAKRTMPERTASPMPAVPIRTTQLMRPTRGDGLRSAKVSGAALGAVLLVSGLLASVMA